MKYMEVKGHIFKWRPNENIDDHLFKNLINFIFIKINLLNL